MRTLDKKMFVNLGKVFLVGGIFLANAAHAGTSADGGDQKLCGQIPPSLKKLRDDANPEKKCQKNKGVQANMDHGDGEDGACEGVYKAIRDAVNDYEDKTCRGIELQDKIIKQKDSCGTGGSKTAQDDCIKQARTLEADSAKIQQDRAKAAEGLISWITKRKQNAEEAKKDLESTGQQISNQAKADSQLLKSPEVAPKDFQPTARVRKDWRAVPAFTMADVASGISGDIEAMKKEQAAAIKNAETAAQQLKSEAAKSSASATQLEKMAKTSNSNAGNMGSTDKGAGGGQAGSQAGNGQGSGQGGGAGGGAGGGMPSPPGGGQGGESGAGSPMADSGANAPSTGNLSPNAMANKTDSSGKSTDLKLDTTPKKSATGDLSPSASGEILSGTGSSKLDTSLRDSLKKKILGDAAEGGGSDALGGLGFGANSADPKKAGAPGAAAAAAGGGGFSVPGFSDSGGGGDSGGGDFSMARSETEAAVHNLLNEFGGTGANGADGRAIASTSDAEAGIEGMEGTSLIHRVHEAIVRRLKNGSVANGVNGKI